MIRTFVDSGVLIAAARGNTTRSTAALQFLNEIDREFASSIFVQLETKPKAIYNNQMLEMSLYEAFFSNVTHWATDLEQIVQVANRIAATYGLAAMDALHIAAALSIAADEFVTTEKLTKPMHRITEIQVVSIAG